LLTGTGISSSARISAGAKSPLTGGIKESNSGGLFTALMVRSGFRALVFEGVPTDETLKLLVIDGEDIALEDATDLENLSVFQTFEILQERYGDKAGIICIGQAGEQKLPAAAIMSVDPFGHARAMARGGLGAVMGAKRIKAMVVKDNREMKPAAADEAKLKEQRKKFNQLVLEDPRLENRKQYGTAAIVNAVNAMGALPTYSFRQGNFEHAENLSGEKLHDTIVERKGQGKVSAPCMLGCLISCGNVYPDSKGEAIVSTLQYETIGMLGSNCGIDNLDDVAYLNKLCNDYGLDTIETGVVLGILMDVGYMKFGDVKSL
jgi:aldehyde:ferredoxin oxidoreductase